MEVMFRSSFIDWYFSYGCGSSNAFDRLSLEMLVAKLSTHGLEMDAMHLIY